MTRKLEMELDENNGILKYAGARVILAHEAFLSTFQKSLEEFDPRLAHRVCYQNGEESSREAVNSTEKMLLGWARHLDKRKMVERLLLLALERGFGLMRLGSFDYSKGKGAVIVENSVIARTYGKAKKPICFNLAGIIAGAAQVVYGSDFTCTEKKCLATGTSHYCEFELSPATKQEREKFIEEIE